MPLNSLMKAKILSLDENLVSLKVLSSNVACNYAYRRSIAELIFFCPRKKCC